MKTKISFVLIISLCFSAFSIRAQNNPGFGVKQTQGILKGILLGGTFGGVIGNQKSKSVEGALIGGTIGALIGSKTGQNQDFRRKHEIEATQLDSRRAIRVIEREREAAKYERGITISHPHSVSKSQISNDSYNDPEIVAARQRAEWAESELKRFEALKKIQSSREKLLLQYKHREMEANRKLFKNHKL